MLDTFGPNKKVLEIVEESLLSRTTVVKVNEAKDEVNATL